MQGLLDSWAGLRSFKSRLIISGCVGVIIALGGCAKSTPEAGTEAKAPTVSASAAPSAMASKIDVNKASIAELDKLELPGTKPSLSERIQQGRPYAKIDDLVSKKVISSEELVLIKGLITTGDAK